MYLRTKAGAGYGPAPFAAGGFGQPPTITLDPGEMTKFLDATSEINKQLKLNFRADDVAGYLDRRKKLRKAFESVPDSFAKSLVEQLSDSNDPLAKLFKYKLATPTRNEMILILLKKSGLIIGT